MSVTPTTPQAVSRILRVRGCASAMRVKAVQCHAGRVPGTVTVIVYPGDPRYVADVLNTAGYEAVAGHRSVSVTGRRS